MCWNIYTYLHQKPECVVSDMSCVKQQPDDGSYPVPTAAQVVPKFDTKFFNGKLYITAGQNKLFDIFDCQVHFFTETEPGTYNQTIHGCGCGVFWIHVRARTLTISIIRTTMFLH